MKRLMTAAMCVVMAVPVWAASGNEGFPVTVTDQIGREVTIDTMPESIVSGYYISTSAAVGIGLKDRISGIEAKAEKRAFYQKCEPEMIALPNVGTLKEFDLEACAALQPELVILGAKQKDAIEPLEDLGMNVIVVKPESRQDLADMIALIAAAAGEIQEGEKLTAFISTQEEVLEESLAEAEKPTVYFGSNASILSTAGSKMFQADQIAMAGGVNVAAAIEDTYWADVDYEQILAWDPEYIILASDAEYSVEDVLADENLQTLRAVKEQKVYHMPNDPEAWDSPVPSSILGTIWMASILHNDIIPADSFEQITADYYETFYGYDTQQ